MNVYFLELSHFILDFRCEMLDYKKLINKKFKYNIIRYNI